MKNKNRILEPKSNIQLRYKRLCHFYATETSRTMVAKCLKFTAIIPIIVPYSMQSYLC